MSWHFLFAEAWPAGHPHCPPVQLSQAEGWQGLDGDAPGDRGCRTLGQGSPPGGLSPPEILRPSRAMSVPRAGWTQPPEGPLPLWNEDPEDIGGPRPFKPPPQAALSVTISRGPPCWGCFSEPEEGTFPRPSALAQPPGLGLASLSPIPAPSGVTEPPWHPAPRRAAPHTLV